MPASKQDVILILRQTQSMLKEALQDRTRNQRNNQTVKEPLSKIDSLAKTRSVLAQNRQDQHRINKEIYQLRESHHKVLAELQQIRESLKGNIRERKLQVNPVDKRINSLEQDMDQLKMRWRLRRPWFW